MRRGALVLMATVTVCANGCGGGETPLPVDGPPEALVPTDADRVVRATVAPAGDEGTGAYGYDESVPAGAEITVSFKEIAAQRSEVGVYASGLDPGHDYAADLHVRPCTPEAPTPVPAEDDDPDSPGSGSPNPAYRHNGEKVWFSLSADAEGDAHATNTLGWRIDPQDVASLVVHSGAGGRDQAGTGAFLACVDIPR
ncbi:hypothetical protein [Marinactinospora thermotolerans]|uniref:Superoxide dismutase, Cu-Zn family n=2 Tax=Marinactinospora thermotolerans TaxID=531310 RepID=A0A1T4JWL5_9ACTN|nr:hypothetical protein SAMN02745673_00023 [Marinactinospora thermotolerans DSM 45154]